MTLWPPLSRMTHWLVGRLWPPLSRMTHWLVGRVPLGGGSAETQVRHPRQERGGGKRPEQHGSKGGRRSRKPACRRPIALNYPTPPCERGAPSRKWRRTILFFPSRARFAASYLQTAPACHRDNRDRATTETHCHILPYATTQTRGQGVLSRGWCELFLTCKPCLPFTAMIAIVVVPSCRPARTRTAQVRATSSSIPPDGGQFDFAWLPPRTHHGAYVR